MTTNYLTTQVPTHARRVLSLYKKSLRCLRDHYPRIHEYHYYAAFLRKAFDDTKDIKDFVEADKKYKMAEIHLKSYTHSHPKKFYTSPGGTAYGRYIHFPDWLLDTWHPLEKAQYPEYFARREIRKKEFIENWEKKYGTPEGASS